MILFAIAYRLLQKLLGLGEKSGVKKRAKQDFYQQKLEENVLNCCPVCETYFQKDQGIHKKGTYFCSQECADKMS